MSGSQIRDASKKKQLQSLQPTHVVKSSATIGWPGWPCAYANEEIVVIPEFLSAILRGWGTRTCSKRRLNCASESTRDVMASLPREGIGKEELMTTKNVFVFFVTSSH